MNYASRTNRWFGQLLDTFVAVAPLLGTTLLAEFRGVGGFAAILMLAAAAWTFGYIFLADGMQGGQSFGKRWLGMSVIDAASGEPCTFGKSFLRNLSLVILGPLDWIFIFGDSRRRLGDMIAGTVVISRD